MRTLIPAALIALLIAGCGGGGGGAAGGSGAQPGTVLGSASFPGAAIVVSRTSGTAAAGAAMTLRVTSVDPGIASVDVLIGTHWESATPATVVGAGAGTWDVTMTLPSPLPAGAAVLVRLTFSDGNVVESSLDAFKL